MKESAFPVVFTTGDNKTHVQLGMTLRDWFAGEAMRGVVWTDDEGWRANMATVCYAIADAMLKAREEK